MSAPAMIDPYRATIAMATGDFRHVLTRKGMTTACRYSETAEAKAETLDQAIYAIAFDCAAMTVDQGVSDAKGTKPKKQFLSDTVRSRATQSLTAKNFPEQDIEPMLEEILAMVRASLVVMAGQRRKP